MITSRKLARDHAADLMRCIIEQDTCRDPYLTEYRAAQLDKAFRKLAADLGYTVERTEIDVEQAA